MRWWLLIASTMAYHLCQAYKHYLQEDQMPLLYKPDWEGTKQHYLAWWAHEAFGRCGLSIYAPRSVRPASAPPPPPADPIDCWIDLDYVTARNQYIHEN